MKKYTLLGHVFELEENAYHFLSRYIDRIEHYAATHTISHDVIDDIKYSIIEKLYAFETPIKEKQVLDVANSLGEPEVMFDETYDGAGDEYERKDNIFVREKPVVWGVCYWLAKSLNVPVKIMRIIFLILAVLQGTGLFLYVILAIFVPYKDKKKTTGALGGVIFEVLRIVLWLFVLSIIIPLTLAAIAGIGFLFFTPVIDNQSISAWIPGYMYGVGIAIIVSLLLLSIGAIGALFKQRWINKTLGLLATVMIMVGVMVTIGAAYKTAMVAMSHTTTVEQEIAFSGSTVSGSRVTIDMSKTNDDTDQWPYFGISNADVKIVRVGTGSDIVVNVSSSMRGQSDEQLADIASKLVPLGITGDANNITFYRNGKLFSSEVPLAGVQRAITIYVPRDKEVYIQKNWRMNMSVQNDYAPGMGYCEAKVYVYSSKEDAFVCKNIQDSHINNGFDDTGDLDKDIEDLIEQTIQERVQQKIEEKKAQQGYNAVPPMYPEE